MVEAMGEGAVTVTPNGTILYCNERFAKMVKAGQETIIGSSLLARFAEADAATIGKALCSRHRDSRKRANLLTLDGARFPVNVAMHRLVEEDRRYVVIVVSDLTHIEESERALAESELRLRTVMDTNVDGIVMVDVETQKFLYANQAFYDQLGYAVDEVSALSLADIHPPDVLAGKWRNFERRANSEARTAKDIPTKRKDGSIFFADISASPAMLGGRQYMVTCFHDVTDRKVAEEKLSAMARYDPLTGLANCNIFVNTLDHAIARAHRGERGGFAVLYLDLDHFKDVNDTLGHPVGDLLLQAVAARLLTAVRATDTVARFGGDEFCILLPVIEDPAHAAVIADHVMEAVAQISAVELVATAGGTVADKVLQAIGEPFSIEGNDIHTGVSIGIAVYQAESTNSETMLSHADVALYRAKAEGRGTFRFFDTAMENEVRARVALGGELREGIASGQFFLVYQPQVDDETDRIVGLEALVRWNHPTRGLLGPGHFIPEAERNGLIVPLGHWILRETCHQAKKWLDAGIAPQSVAVNLSAVQFKQPLQLEKNIAAILAETGLPPHLLELELTEGVLMDATAEHNDLLLRFRAAGHHIAIDDFGTGYSSLDYLSRFTVDRVKIAQSFVLDLQVNTRNQAIVKGAISLAHALGLLVIVEGVETAEQLAMIKSWGCRLIQGFYFSKPLPVDEITALLRIGKITRTAAGA